MRAAFMPGPGLIEVGEFPVPIPKDGQVLVQMHHASICGSDVHMVFDGFHHEERIGAPGYPGHEGVGVVVASTTRRFPEGTRVLTAPPAPKAGCFAEFQVVDVEHLVPLPRGENAENMLMAQQLGTTVFALKKFLRHPETTGNTSATIIGAGSAGLFFLQQLLNLGYDTVVVADLNADRLDEAARLGATHLAHCPTDSLVHVTKDATNGSGADLVIEAAGYDSCRTEAVEAVRDHGTVGFFGFPERHGLAAFPVYMAYRKRLAMEWVTGTQFEPQLSSFQTAMDLIHRGEIAVDYCLRTAYELEDVPAALAAARARRHGAVKIQVTLPAGLAHSATNPSESRARDGFSRIQKTNPQPDGIEV